MTLRCLFCNKSQKEVALLVRGNLIAGRGGRSACICDTCVETAMLAWLKRKLGEPT